MKPNDPRLAALYVVLIIAAIAMMIAAFMRIADDKETDTIAVEAVAEERHHWDVMGVQLDGSVRLGCRHLYTVGKGMTLQKFDVVRERCVLYAGEDAAPETVECEGGLRFPLDEMWPVTTECP